MPEGNGNLPGVLKIKIRKKDPAAVLPAYETEGAAGMDIRAFLPGEVRIPPMGRVKIPTGLFMEIPGGYEVQVRPRSGMAIRSGVTVLNAPGTIDSDFRGEVEIILINLGTETFTVKSGDRIAQLVVARVFKADIAEAFSLSETPRGEGGFGSTGV
ncbi:MAG: dUTP diphosphatase [Treponema sp.]|jgi:dUTP pyrophosphatase|nr:dUTP diphosphatase [Treponema sp.]